MRHEKGGRRLVSMAKRRRCSVKRVRWRPGGGCKTLLKMGVVAFRLGNGRVGKRQINAACSPPATRVLSLAACGSPTKTKTLECGIWMCR